MVLESNMADIVKEFPIKRVDKIFYKLEKYKINNFFVAIFLLYMYRYTVLNKKKKKKKKKKKTDSGKKKTTFFIIATNFSETSMI